MSTATVPYPSVTPAASKNGSRHSRSADQAAPNSRAPLDAFLQSSSFPAELAPFVKYEFDKHLHYFGAHFSHGYDRAVAGRDVAAYRTELFEFFWKHQPRIEQALEGALPSSERGSAVFSSAYFGWQQPLAGLGVQLVASPWTAAQPGDELSVLLFNQCRAIQELFRSGFSVFYDVRLVAALRAARETLRRFYARHPAQGLMLPFTNGFFEGVSAEIFRELGRKTFLCIHGIPARLDWWKAGEHPVDFIVVWGEAMKRRIVASGRDASAVLVSGHPNYSGKPLPTICSTLDQVLVLGYAQCGAPLLDLPLYQDRALGLDYLWRVQACLREVGVQSARMRPHPSESAEWYRMHLDSAFYVVDESKTCAEALARSTLVIGPVSTVLIDAAVAGRNYLTFVPSHPHYNPIGAETLEPDVPFDGSDGRFPVARNEEQLIGLLRGGAKVDPAALPDYLSSAFDANVVVNAIGFGPSPARASSVAARTLAVPQTAPSRIYIAEAAEVAAKPFELQVLQTVRPFTMTPPEVTLNALRAAAAVEEHQIEGAIVECGVWRGGVSMAMMHQLKKLGARRNLFLYDTYDGMSEPTEEDRSPAGDAAAELLAAHKKDEANHYWAFAPIERVRRNIESVGYPMELVRMVQGKVEDTIPGVIPEKIALLRLDTDWYESTRHELVHLYSRLVSGGVLILDDYGFWQGARKAVDEFFATLAEKPELHVVHDQLNSCVRWAIKP